MSIGDSIVELRKLLSAPEGVRKNEKRIGELLRQAKRSAEGEVLRLMVLAATGTGLRIAPETLANLRSRDPRVRLDAIRSIDALAAPGEAAQALRLVMKDPDPRARSAARHVVRTLGLADVALPDVRFKVSKWIKIPKSTTPGAWNPTGWAFGVYQGVRPKPMRADVIAKADLPKLASVAALAKHLGLAAGDLARLGRPGTGPGRPYVEFEIPKATGGVRVITAPKTRLRKVQRAILDTILAKIPVGPHAHGFVRERSTVTNAAPHVGAAVVVKLDLVEFFPSVHFRRVVGLFEALGYGAEVATALASLTTFRPVLADGVVAWPGALPQGAPSSPAIANLVSYRLDRRLAALAKRAGATYTRYADDLTFSFAKEPERLGRFLWWADQICQQEGFAENTKKRRVLRPSNQQRVTGVIVNQSPHVPRKDRHKFRAVLHSAKTIGLESAAAKWREGASATDLAAWLRGWAAYVHMVQPELGAKLVGEVRGLLGA